MTEHVTSSSPPTPAGDNTRQSFVAQSPLQVKEINLSRRECLLDRREAEIESIHRTNQQDWENKSAQLKLAQARFDLHVQTEMQRIADFKRHVVTLIQNSPGFNSQVLFDTIGMVPTDFLPPGLLAMGMGHTTNSPILPPREPMLPLEFISHPSLNSTATNGSFQSNPVNTALNDDDGGDTDDFILLDQGQISPTISQNEEQQQPQLLSTAQVSNGEPTNLLSVALESSLQRITDAAVMAATPNEALYFEKLSQLKSITKSLRSQTKSLVLREGDLKLLSHIKTMTTATVPTFINPYLENEVWYSKQYLVDNPDILTRITTIREDFMKNWVKASSLAGGVKVNLINLGNIYRKIAQRDAEAANMIENTSDLSKEDTKGKDNPIIIQLWMRKEQSGNNNVAIEPTNFSTLNEPTPNPQTKKMTFAEKLWSLDTDYSITFAKMIDFRGYTDHIPQLTPQLRVFLSSPYVLNGKEVQINGPGCEIPSDIDLTLNHWVNVDGSWNYETRYSNDRCDGCDYRRGQGQCRYSQGSPEMVRLAHSDPHIQCGNSFPTLSLRWE